MEAYRAEFAKVRKVLTTPTISEQEALAGWHV